LRTSTRFRYASLTRAVVCRRWPARSPLQRPVSEAAEFLVDDGYEQVERLPVASLPGEE